MSDQFVAEIRIFSGNFAPYQWAMCSGQLLALSSNTALFTLLGTYYGGNGTSNFGLPNLQGIAAIGQGQGPGLSPYVIGQTAGVATVNLSLVQLPNHTHSLNAGPAAKKEQSTVAGNVPSSGGSSNFYSTTAPNTTMAGTMLAAVGGSQPHDNMQPYLVLNFCIALAGVYPPRQ